VLEGEPGREELDAGWRAARCLTPEGTVLETVPTSAVAPAPGGVVWLQADPFDAEAEGIFIGRGARDSAYIGELSAFCEGDGAIEALVATRPAVGTDDPVARLDRPLWDWWYRLDAGWMFQQIPVVADGGSIAVRDDGIVFLAPVNAHGLGGTGGDNLTPDVLFRMRPEFLPLDPAERMENLDPWRRDFPLMHIHWYEPQEVRALTRVPGLVHDDDSQHLGMMADIAAPPSVADDIADGTDTTPTGDSSGSDDCSCSVRTGGGRAGTTGLLVALLLAFIGLLRLPVRSPQ